MLSLKKGQKADITKSIPSISGIILGVGWNSMQSNGVVADCSAFLIQKTGKVRDDNDFIFYNNKIGGNGSVEYLSGYGEDKERIKIMFDKVPQEIEKIVVTLTIDGNKMESQNFGMLKEGIIRILDEKNQHEIMEYRFSEGFSLETAIVVVEIYRHNGEWKINCIGSGFNGGLKALAENFGLAVEEKKSEVPKQRVAQESVYEIKKQKIGERKNMRCHEVDYEIFGSDLQAVEVELDPGEKVIAEAGAMNWLDDGISFEAKMGDGSKPDSGFFGKLLDAGKRAMMGESLFVTHFTNVGSGKKRVAFAAPYPGKILPIDLSTIGNEIICQKDSFLCAAYGTELNIAFSRKLGTGFFGGEGFILQSLKGDGMAFIHAGGAIVEKKLNGEKIKVDTGCIVGFTKGIDYDIERAGNLKSMLFGGEGLFLATLQGHGTIWLQTLPFSRLADRIIKSAPSVNPNGQSRGEGSVLGGLGRLLDGDNKF